MNRRKTMRRKSTRQMRRKQSIAEFNATKSLESYRPYANTMRNHIGAADKIAGRMMNSRELQGTPLADVVRNIRAALSDAAQYLAEAEDEISGY